MAKKRNLENVPENENSDNENTEIKETGSNEEKNISESENENPEMSNQNTSKIDLRDPKGKLNLTDKRGNKMVVTLEEALLPHNFRRLTEKVQKGLTETGKSTQTILAEIEANK